MKAKHVLWNSIDQEDAGRDIGLVLLPEIAIDPGVRAGERKRQVVHHANAAALRDQDDRHRICAGTWREEHGHGLGRRSRFAGDDIGRDADEDEHVRVPGRASVLGLGSFEGKALG